MFFGVNEELCTYSHSIHITTSLLSSLGQRVFHYIFKETFENKFFKETVVTTFAFNQSSSYITQNIIVQMYCVQFPYSCAILYNCRYDRL